MFVVGAPQLLSLPGEGAKSFGYLDLGVQSKCFHLAELLSPAGEGANHTLIPQLSARKAFESEQGTHPSLLSVSFSSSILEACGALQPQTGWRLLVQKSLVSTLPPDRQVMS